MNNAYTMPRNRFLIFGEQFAFSLDDESCFAQTEYKVMHNEKTLNVVPCVKIHFNELNLLFYMPSGVPLKKIQNSMGIHEYCTVMGGLLDEVRKIRSNGFLNVRNIDLSTRRIFITPENMAVSITYVPSRERLYIDQIDFDKNLKRLCLQILAENPGLQNKEGLALREAIQNCPGDDESLFQIISTAEENSFGLGGDINEQNMMSGELILKSVNPSFGESFRITGDRFVLGRRADAVDGHITSSGQVGRIHAVISRSNGQFYLSDMKSKNGTFVNNVRIERPTLIRNGDILRFGDVDFRAQIM